MTIVWIREEGLPWWCSGWESARHCRGHGFNPWSGKIPHATEQLIPWATTAEATLSSVRAAATEASKPRARALHREATAVRNPHSATKRRPRLPQLEKAGTQQGRPSTTKIK